MANKYECLRFGYLRMSSIKKAKDGRRRAFSKISFPPDNTDMAQQKDWEWVVHVGPPGQNN